MKFWLYFAGLLPALLVLAIAALVLVLFEGMRRDLLRARAKMMARWAVDRTKREGNAKMLITGLTPAPQPRRCVACGVPEGAAHMRGCVMTLTAAPAQAAAAVVATYLEVCEEARQEYQRALFETDLLLFCLERDICLIDVERRH